MKKILPWLFLVPILLFASISRADTDLGVYWARTATIGGTAACVTTTPVSGICAVFASGDTGNNRTVFVQSTAAVRCCWTGVVVSDISSRLAITDSSGPNGSGQGACFDIQNVAHTFMGRPNRTAMATYAAGYRPGLCSTAIVSGGETLHPPCTIGSDCTALGAGSTCVATPTQNVIASSGMFLVCESPTGTPAVHVRKLKLKKD